MANTILNQLKSKYKEGDNTIKLIYINVVVFFSLLIVNFFLKSVLNLTTSTLNLFALSSGEDLLKEPWQLLTYSWLHGSPFHLLANMIFLYFVGQLFLQEFRGNNLITFYLFGGIFGGIFFILLQDIFSYYHLIVGSSAAIYAVFFGLISYNPQKQIRLMFIPSSYPILYLGYALIAFDVYNIITAQNAGGSVSHLGAGLFGYLYMKQLEKGNDFLGKLIHQIENLIRRNKKSKFKKNNSRLSKTSTNDYEYNHQKVEKQKKIDTILEKISRSGYESLSKEEKDFLFREGR